MSSRALRRRLDAGLAAMDTAIAEALDDARRDRLVAFVLLLAHWSRAYNLTAVREPAEMVSRHLLDSLSVLPWVHEGPVLDVGTGPGLPGVPLAIARPGLAFTLLDSNGKKVRFVRQAVLQLGIDNVEVEQSRVEQYRPGAKFATIVARAVASLEELSVATAHLAAPGGRLLAMKGRLPKQELAALARARLSADRAIRASGITDGAMSPRTGGVSVHPLRVPLLDGERNLIEVPYSTRTHG
ncbi:MAG: 16S rRNA (guanine(527)-N(7))-methyltransferase RsmG [Thiohalocapsa sp.]